MADVSNPGGDIGTQTTDSVIEELEKKIKTVYRRAYNEIRQTIIEFNEQYEVKSKEKIKQLENGEITQEQYNAWEAGQKFQSKLWEEKKAHLLSVVNSANQKAADIVNGETQNVFATNANYIGYELEQDVGASVSFSLYDSNTMARLIRDNPQLLPQKKVNEEKDKAWNNKKVVSAIQQGILQGRTIPQIAKSLSSSLAESNMKAMIRTARTAMTSAENAGRLEGMKQAEEDGIKLKKQWLSASDNRVRDAHVELNGQIADIDKPFKSSLGDIMYPGDPEAAPANVYNCRCTLKYVYPEFTKAGANDYYIDEDGNKQPVTDTTFQEWMAIKEQESAEAAIEEQAGNVYNHESIIDEFVMAGDEEALTYFDMMSTIDDLGGDPEAFKKALAEYSVSHGSQSTSETVQAIGAWTNYLDGNMDEESQKKIDELILAAFDKDAKLAGYDVGISMEELKNKIANMPHYENPDEIYFKEEKYKENPLPQADKETAKEVNKIYNNMTDEDDAKFEEATIEISKLKVDQGFVNAETLEWMAEHYGGKEISGVATDDDNGVRVIHYNGEYILIDGNHRVNLAMLNGQEQMKVMVYDYDKIVSEMATEQLSHAEVKDKLFGAEHLSKTIISDLKEKDPELGKELQDALNKIGSQHNMTQGVVLNKYKYDKLSPEETAQLDELFGKAITGEKKPAAEKESAKQDELIGGFPKEVVKKKIEAGGYWDVSYQLQANGEGPDVLKDWHHLVNEYYEQHGYSKTILDAYTDGDLDEKTALKLEEIIAKTIPDTGDPEKHIEAYSAVKNYKITEFKKEIASVNNKLSTDFGKELKSIGDDMGLQAKDVFAKYQKGTLPADKTKAIDDIIGSYLEKKAAGETHTVKKKEKKSTPAQPTVSSEELHKTFSGIWKEDVTYADWEDKKDKIKAKKDYFEQQIAAADYNGDVAKEAKFKALLAHLEEFEKNGKEYSALLAKETPTQAASTASSSKTTTASEGGLKPLTEAEKRLAKLFKDAKKADKFHREYLDSIWDTLTEEEKYSIFEYTRNSNPINKSLSGYHDKWTRDHFIGMDKTEWGHEDRWRNIMDDPNYVGISEEIRKFGTRDGHVDYKKAITMATRAIDKSSLPDDCWFVRGSDQNGLAGLLEGDILSFDKAAGLLDGSFSGFEKLKKIIMNQDFTNHAFTSTGIASGTGFGGSVKYEILAPKGTKAIYAEPQSHYGHTTGGRIYKKGEAYSSVGHEAEVIFQRGTTFRVSDFGYNGVTYNITLEVVEQPSYFEHGDEDTYNNGRTRHKK